jgi:hypothetical protein
MGEPRNRVVQVERFGDPDVLKVVDAPVASENSDPCVSMV